MKLKIPVNWEDDYFEKINFSSVNEIYGKLHKDFVGGGRPVLTIPKVSKSRVEEFIKKAHEKNIEFNYLLNATCLDNLELSRKGYRAIRELLDWVSESGTDIVTVTLPFLAEMVKKHYPNLLVSVSVQARVDCIEKVEYWEGLGADKINLSYVDINRNFEELKRITSRAKSKIQTIANLICINKCPFVTLHGNYNAHNSQTKHIMDNFSFDYYMLNCSYRLFSNPVEILKSAMIRPEDVHYYEECGVDTIKLVERSMTTEALAVIVDAYTKQKFDGNLMDVFPGISKYLIYEKSGLITKQFKYIFQPSKVNVFKVKKMIDDLNKVKKSDTFRKSFNLYIDNSKLDGFMDFFYQGKCKRDCDKCGHCQAYANKAINLLVSEEQHKKDIEIFFNSRECMVTGDLYK